MYENRKYVIFDTSESGSVQFYKPATYNESGSLLTEATASEVLETSAETLRLSVDGSKSFIKYERAPAIAEALYEEGDIIPSGSEVGDLKTAAEEFESLFINEMLKRAHKAKLANSLLSSDAQDTYVSMLNQERSKQFATSHNFGIAEALVKQFSPSEKSLSVSIEKIRKE